MVAAGAPPAVNDEGPAPLERIRDTGLIAVLRGIGPADATPVVDALLAAGVSAIEFTADSADAFELVRQERRRIGDRAAIGMGTVLEVATAREALDAGASFLVTPSVDVEVISQGGEVGVPVIAGAYTPTEAVEAANAGSDMIKIFPAATGGPEHVRAIRGPLEHLSLVPTGGVTVETAGAYISSGATAVAVGGGLFPEGVLEAGRYDEIEARAAAVLRAIHEAR